MSDRQDANAGHRERQLLDALTQAAEAADISISVAYVTEAGADVVYTNDVGLRLLGVSREELDARQVWSFIAPDELPKLLDMHARRLRGEPVPITFQTSLLRADGERIPVEIASHRLELDGRPSHHVSRFQIIAPVSAASTVSMVTALAATRPLLIVCATAVPASAPTRFQNAAQATAWRGVSTLVELRSRWNSPCRETR